MTTDRIATPKLPQQKTTIKAILFDLDGTLLDTEALSDRAVLDAFGNSLSSSRRQKWRDPNRLPWELKRRILGLRGSEWIPIVLKYAADNWGVVVLENDDERKSVVGDEVPPCPSVNEFWMKWENRLNELCRDVQACAGAGKIVSEFAKLRIPMAIATSSRAASVRKKRFRHEDMFKHMSAIVTGDDPNVRNGKPAPDIYQEAAKRLNVDTCDCLVVEDALQGVLSGKSAGCRVIAIPDPRMDKEEFGMADLVLDSFWEFDGEIWGIDVKMGSSV